MPLGRSSLYLQIVPINYRSENVPLSLEFYTDTLLELLDRAIGAVHFSWFRRKPPNPVPRVVRAHPPSFVSGGGETLVSVMGQGFVSDSEVTYRAKALPATLVSSDQLTFKLTKSDIVTTDANSELVVVNSPPRGWTFPNPSNVPGNPKPS